MINSTPISQDFNRNTNGRQFGTELAKLVKISKIVLIYRPNKRCLKSDVLCALNNMHQYLFSSSTGRWLPRFRSSWSPWRPTLRNTWSPLGITCSPRSSPWSTTSSFRWKRCCVSWWTRPGPSETKAAPVMVNLGHGLHHQPSLLLSRHPDMLRNTKSFFHQGLKPAALCWSLICEFYSTVNVVDKDVQHYFKAPINLELSPMVSGICHNSRTHLTCHVLILRVMK